MPGPSAQEVLRARLVLPAGDGQTRGRDPFMAVPLVDLPDEKPSIQGRDRIAATLALTAGMSRGQRVEQTYQRRLRSPTWPWDVRRGGVIGRCELKGGNRLRSAGWLSR